MRPASHSSVFWSSTRMKDALSKMAFKGNQPASSLCRANTSSNGHPADHCTNLPPKRLRIPLLDHSFAKRQRELSNYALLTWRLHLGRTGSFTSGSYSSDIKALECGPLGPAVTPRPLISQNVNSLFRIQVGNQVQKPKTPIPTAISVSEPGLKTISVIFEAG